MMQIVALCLATGFVLSVSSASVVKMEELFASRHTACAWMGRQANAERTSPISGAGDPPQCRKYACPPSKLVEDRGSYKKVYFPEAPYAKSRLEGQNFISASMELYKRLRDYITGENDNGITLPMTAPVILRNDVSSPGDMFSPKNFTMFFLIDPSVKCPPAPKRKDIEVLMVNDYTLYIRTFSGYPVLYGDWMRELMLLAADVEADEEPFTTTYYYFSSYDAPDKTTGRINEVQLLKPHTNDGL